MPEDVTVDATVGATLDGTVEDPYASTEGAQYGSEPADPALPVPVAPKETVKTIAPGPAGGARIALVIDDLGRSLADVDKLERLGVPISYAVLPFETKTPQVVAKLRGLGAEILLHLPMEPGSGANPGPGALRVGMSSDQLTQATRAALAAVPGATGVNNHMGSRLSADGDAMNTVLSELVGRRLFFLDSRTSAASLGYSTARALGLAAAERQVFLDRDPAVEQVRYQFHRLLEVARKRGAGIAIGHPYPATFQVLAEEVPKARALGYEIVPVSFLLDQPGQPPL